MAVLVRGTALRAVASAGSRLAVVNEHGIARVWTRPIVAVGADFAKWLDDQTMATIDEHDALAGGVAGEEP
jgi:hypothetical protein